MAHTYNWTRRKLSSKDYAVNMKIPSERNKETEFVVTVNGDDKKYTVTLGADFIESLTDSSKHSNAYKVAADIRKFEIDKYWQRTLYFWGFITAVYVAYFNVLKEFYTDSCTGIQTHGSIPLVILSALGLFFCFSWLLASKGSKHWQENWENHLDLLEDEITGPLYKTYSAGNSYSVSGINIMAGRVLSLCAYGLLMYEILNFVENTLKLKECAAIGISVLFMLFIIVALFVYSNSVKGNTKNSGSIEFDIKEYGDINEK